MEDEHKMFPIIIGPLGTVKKNFPKKLEDLEIWWKMETFPSTALLKLARLLERVLVYWEVKLSFDFWVKPLNTIVIFNVDKW